MSENIYVERMSNFIGPTLPPHLLRKASTDEDSNANSERKNKLRRSKENEDIGPTLPPHILQIASEDAVSNDWERGPPLLSKKKITQAEMSEDSSDDVIGPIPARYKVNDKMEDSSYVGPSLPPQLQRNLLDTHKKNKEDENKSSHSSDSSVDDACMIGPVIPKSLQGPEDEDDFQASSVNVCVIGPKIPSFLMSKSKQKPVSVSEDKEPKHTMIGPSLPPHLAERVDEMPTIVDDVTNTDVKSSNDLSPPGVSERNPNSEVDSDMYGPALPPGFSVRTSLAESSSKTLDSGSDSDDGTAMGPLPEGVLSSSKVQHQLEMRARHLRETMAFQEKGTPQESVRESWMLELPEDRAPELGLKPRQFRMREAPKGGDRSVWTDTPADREKKRRTPKSESPDHGALERLAMQKRDKAMEEVAEQHGKKRGSRSLVEIHEEKLAEKRKKEAAAGERPERRPFSREIDLQVNRFDEAQKRSIMKKAHQLNDRFSSGQSKFL